MNYRNDFSQTFDCCCCNEEITPKTNTREPILKEPHNTEQKNHLFNIDESKNVCLHFTSQADIYYTST